MTSSRGSNYQALWDLVPTLSLVIAILTPPFAGSMQIYRAAMFLLMGHTLVECVRRPPKLDGSLKLILGLGAFFTAWSLLSAIFGIDPKYSLRRWQSEHLYVFLFFCAIVLNPRPLRVQWLLWAGVISTCLIALGMLLDPNAMGQETFRPLKELGPRAKKSMKLWQVAFTKGFSTDIIWLTSHLLLVYWLGLAAILANSFKQPLFYAGIISTLAGCWVVTHTFQIMPFLAIILTTAAFGAVWILQKYGRRGAWALVALAALTLGLLVVRDMAIHPEKKLLAGLGDALWTGKTQNSHIQSRINSLRWAIKKCPERPWLGWGPGREILRTVEPETFDRNDSEIERLRDTHPPLGHLHNQFADLLVRVGIPGLLAYILFLGAILVAGFRSGVMLQNWSMNPTACIRGAALVASLFVLVRLLSETYPASSVAAQFWMLLAFAARPALAGTRSKAGTDAVDDSLLVRGT